ncbi:MAG: exopolyphosphatase, partial [Burkholderiales bacterium]|nr:exopolyphosphatase [Burkholderiales bacterium]
MTDKLLATVDLGSNSFRLLIGKVHDDGTVYPIDQIKETVRLASGLNANENLTKESQLIALEALSRFGERLNNFKKSQVRVVATSTLRVAKNANEFISVANKALGFPIEVISGHEEARLVYIGAMHSLAYTSENRLVVDIGGGSTEFIIGQGYDPKVMESVTMGCVSFTGRYFANGELTEDNFENATLAARSKIQSMEHMFAEQKWSLAIGTSGTAKTLYDMCVENGLSNEITYTGMQQLKKLLIKSKSIKNIKVAGIKEDRKAVIAGGISIMLAIFEELGIENMTISAGALREGVMYDLIGRKTSDDLREVKINDIKKR